MERLLVANIGWMKAYKGYKAGVDVLTGGGSYDDRKKHEQFNFLPIDGYYYGYAQPTSNKITCERIEKTYKGKDKIDKVTVVFVAKHPEGGRVIIGWYRNATVYSTPQEDYSGKRNGYVYFFKAKVQDCVLLDPLLRGMEIPTGKGFIGRSNIAYLDATTSDVKVARQAILRFIADYSFESSLQRRKKRYHVDTESKKLIEESAVRYTSEYFRTQGYSVKSVEKDNKGWDLEAVKDGQLLRIEVKGKFFPDITAQLSANEYAMMNKYKDSYCLSIVTGATLPVYRTLHNFLYRNGIWTDDEGNEIEFDERVAAVVSIK